MERRTGSHTAESLRELALNLRASADRLEEAAKLLDSVPQGTIHVTGSRGLLGTPRHPGAIPKLQKFSADAAVKARMLEREYRRRHD